MGFVPVKKRPPGQLEESYSPYPRTASLTGSHKAGRENLWSRFQ